MKVMVLGLFLLAFVAVGIALYFWSRDDRARKAFTLMNSTYPAFLIWPKKAETHIRLMRITLVLALIALLWSFCVLWQRI